MNPILLLSVAVILLPAAPPAPPSPSVAMPSYALEVWGDCPGNPGTCVFGVNALDPSLIFFRWDFNNDGVFDDPDQTGGGNMGKWTTDTSVSRPFNDNRLLTVVVQGWDGVSTRRVGVGRFPGGGIDSFTFLLGGNFTVSPASWDRTSTGPVYASWTVPGTFVPRTSQPQTATIAGVPATPMIVLRKPGEPIVVSFEVDRAALTAALGPGSHYVRLRGFWSEPPVSLRDGVHFFGDGQVTIT